MVEDSILDLTDLEYMILLTLARRAGEIVSRDELVERVLERELTPFDRSVDAHIVHLRQKLESIEGFTGAIRTIRNSGYLFVSDRKAVAAKIAERCDREPSALQYR